MLPNRGQAAGGWGSQKSLVALPGHSSDAGRHLRLLDVPGALRPLMGRKIVLAGAAVFAAQWQVFMRSSFISKPSTIPRLPDKDGLGPLSVLSHVLGARRDRV